MNYFLNSTISIHILHSSIYFDVDSNIIFTVVIRNNLLYRNQNRISRKRNAYSIAIYINDESKSICDTNPLNNKKYIISIRQNVQRKLSLSQRALHIT